MFSLAFCSFVGFHFLIQYLTNRRVDVKLNFRFYHESQPISPRSRKCFPTTIFLSCFPYFQAFAFHFYISSKKIIKQRVSTHFLTSIPLTLSNIIMHRSNQNFNSPTPHPGKPWAFDHFLCPESEEFDFPLPSLIRTPMLTHSKNCYNTRITKQQPWRFGELMNLASKP